MTVIAASVENRACDALLVCVARFGLAKTTLDDIAREAGCSRATLYRHFDGKAAIVGRAVTVELERMTDDAVAAGLECATLDDAVVAVTTCVARELAGHEALWFLLVHEPESILAHLAFAEGDRLIGRVGDALAPAFSRWLSPIDAMRAGEWLSRVLRSYVLMPEPSIDLADASSAREFLAELVVPGFRSGGSHG